MGPRPTSSPSKLMIGRSSVTQSLPECASVRAERARCRPARTRSSDRHGRSRDLADLFPSGVGGFQFFLGPLIFDAEPGEGGCVGIDAGDGQGIADLVELAFELADLALGGGEHLLRFGVRDRAVAVAAVAG